MAEDLPLVLQLPRVEDSPDPESILLHVSQNGSKPLDLKLVGTDSENVFVVSCKVTLVSPYSIWLHIRSGMTSKADKLLQSNKTKFRHSRRRTRNNHRMIGRVL